MHTRTITTPPPSTIHQSILSEDIVSLFAPSDGDVILDATLGGGGLTEAFLMIPGVSVIALDADARALLRAQERLARAGVLERATLLPGNFADLTTLLAKEGIRGLSHAIFDLGLSSDQLADESRGFSFLNDAPLRMAYGEEPRLGIDADELLATWSEEDIANVLFGYGEERYARRIARAICKARREKPVRTTGDLVRLIDASTPASYRAGKRHPATKSFQALRIAVNDELASLRAGLSQAFTLLSSGGVLAALTFHSIEDREVKTLFRTYVDEGKGALAFKKPRTPSRTEILRNPRARSAKLRAIRKQ